MHRYAHMLLAGAILVGTAMPAVARPFKVTNDVHTLNNATFFSKATLVTIKGQTDQVVGLANVNMDNLGVTSGTIKVDVHAFDTGIAKRNEHMQGVMETSKYSYAEFKPTKIISLLKKPLPNQPLKVAIEGTMTLHGITKPIKVDAVITYLPEQDKSYRPGDWFQLETTFPLKLSDYNVKAPGIVPVKVADDLTIALTVMAKAQ
ncbi:MAG: YceI family protein [Candidatus Sericytochromatia bacterium]|nr:YceI family protein [Candidatus Sericytochromatia bacterium]